VLATVHTALPDVALSPGLDELTAWVLGGQALAPYYRIVQVPVLYSGIPVVTADRVALAHSQGLTVWAWATDAGQESLDSYRQWLAMGVDGILAGRPADVVTALGASA
jgi:glycerophosphoryl diester phosphodiesterase